MSRIRQKFAELKSEGRKALIPYVSCGDPTLKFTEKLVLQLQEAGTDILELGFPYSDPVADGPTIQRASQRALAGGVTIAEIFQLVSGLRPYLKIPVVFMTYYNTIYRWGLERFVKMAAKAEIDGIIVPDIPPEEAHILKQTTDNFGIDLIFLVAPTSTVPRIKKVVQMARGFVYCVSVTGVTGSRKDLNPELDKFLTRVRAETDLPLAVGFGITGPEMVRKVAQIADGVIVGSSLIDRIEKRLDLIASKPEEVVNEACRYLKSLKDSMDN